MSWVGESKGRKQGFVWPPGTREPSGGEGSIRGLWCHLLLNLEELRWLLQRGPSSSQWLRHMEDMSVHDRLSKPSILLSPIWLSGSVTPPTVSVLHTGGLSSSFRVVGLTLEKGTLAGCLTSWRLLQRRAFDNQSDVSGCRGDTRITQWSSGGRCIHLETSLRFT